MVMSSSGMPSRSSSSAGSRSTSRRSFFRNGSIVSVAEGPPGQMQEHVFEAGALQVEAAQGGTGYIGSPDYFSEQFRSGARDEPHRTRLGAGHAACPGQVLQVADQLVHRSVSLQLDGDLLRDQDRKR